MPERKSDFTETGNTVYDFLIDYISLLPTLKVVKCIFTNSDEYFRMAFPLQTLFVGLQDKIEKMCSFDFNNFFILYRTIVECADEDSLFISKNHWLPALLFIQRLYDLQGRNKFSDLSSINKIILIIQLFTKESEKFSELNVIQFEGYSIALNFFDFMKDCLPKKIYVSSCSSGGDESAVVSIDECCESVGKSCSKYSEIYDKVFEMLPEGIYKDLGIEFLSNIIGLSDARLNPETYMTPILAQIAKQSKLAKCGLLNCIILTIYGQQMAIDFDLHIIITLPNGETECIGCFNNNRHGLKLIADANRAGNHNMLMLEEDKCVDTMPGEMVSEIIQITPGVNPLEIKIEPRVYCLPDTYDDTNPHMAYAFVSIIINGQLVNTIPIQFDTHNFKKDAVPTKFFKNHRKYVNVGYETECVNPSDGSKLSLTFPSKDDFALSALKQKKVKSGKFREKFVSIIGESLPYIATLEEMEKLGLLLYHNKNETLCLDKDQNAKLCTKKTPKKLLILKTVDNTKPLFILNTSLNPSIVANRGCEELCKSESPFVEIEFPNRLSAIKPNVETEGIDISEINRDWTDNPPKISVKAIFDMGDKLFLALDMHLPDKGQYIACGCFAGDLKPKYHEYKDLWAERNTLTPDFLKESIAIGVFVPKGSVIDCEYDEKEVALLL